MFMGGLKNDLATNSMQWPAAVGGAHLMAACNTTQAAPPADDRQQQAPS